MNGKQTNAIIQIVPEIKRLSLTHVGRWKDLILDFTSSLNVITGMGGCGKSTILQSILHAVYPLGSDQYHLSPTYPFATGRIGIEFNTQSVFVNIPTLNRIHNEPSIDESRGQFMLSQLRAYIGGAPQGFALLIEGEITSSLDEMQYHQASELLNIATCQIVCIIRNRFSLKDFPNARVYNCYVDSNGIAQIKLQ